MRVLRAAIEATERGLPAALVTIIGINGSAPRAVGSRMLVYADGRIVGTVGGGALEHMLIARARDAIQVGTPARHAVHLTRDLGMCCGGAMEAFIEPLPARDHLVIYGAGHVGTATAHLAAALDDLDVTVVDDREDWIDPERFPARIRCIEADPRRVLDTLPWGPRAYHFVTTHSHALDQDLVEHILPRAPGWAGLIGSRTKVARFFLRFKAAGMDEALFARLSAPVGLDIGAQTPAEIAISVLAELVAVRRRHTRPSLPLSAIPLPARGGDGRAHPPALEASAPPAAADPETDG